MEHPITKRRRVLLRITVLAVGLGAIPTSPAQSPTTDPTVVQVEGGKFVALLRRICLFSKAYHSHNHPSAICAGVRRSR
jgi:hypothetical protein